MDSAKLILLAIALLGVILIILIVYLLASGPKSRAGRKASQSQDAPTQDMLRRLQADQQPLSHQPPSHIPGMDTVNERVSQRPQEPVRSATPSDATPPAGTARVDLPNPLAGGMARQPRLQDDRTPAGGTSLVQPTSPSAADTAPQEVGRPSIAPPRPSIAPPKPSVAPPRRNRTVAMSAGLFADAQRDTSTPKASAPLSDAWSQPSSARDTPVASSLRTPSMAPRVSPTPQRPPLIPDAQELQDTLETKAPTPLDHFRDRSRPPRERLDAYKKLLSSAEPDEKVLYLVEGINADVMEIQLIALQEITARQDDSLLDEVIPLVDADEPNVALGAIKALENIGGPIVEQTLLMALDSDSEAVRERAFTALIENASPSLQAQLHDMLQDDDERSIDVAARLLGQLGGPENAELLEVRASLLKAGSALQHRMQSAATEARTRTTSRATTKENPFESAQEITSTEGIEEFELSLDPEIFNPKS